MVNQRYSMAMAETLHYLKGISQNDINKIPNNFMEFLKANASQNYECKFDYTRPLKDLELMNETRGLIAMICLNYWCETEEQKNSFKKHLSENETRYQEELKRKYNPDDIFKNRDQNILEKKNLFNNIAMVEYKESIFMKIIHKIMSIFKR